MRPSSSTLLVWAGAPCVYGCATCPIDATSPGNGLDSAELQRLLAALPQCDGRLIVLTGGEPLLRPDILRLLATVRAAGCVPGIVTTGRALTYAQVREKLRRAGVEYVRVQLFGYAAEHDAATALPGSYEQAISGVRAWIGDPAVTCDTDVALYARGRSSASLAADVAAIAGDIAASDVQIIVAGESLAADEVATALAGLAHWNDDPGRPLVLWEGLTEADSPAACATIPILGARFLGATPAASCLGRRDRLSREPAEAHPRSNSFNFVRTDTAVRYTVTAAECGAYAAACAADRDRQLWLIEGQQLSLYTTDTGDFNAAAIARIKDTWSHLFVDRAAAGVLDDFTEGMRRILPDPVCATCAQRSSCAGRYSMVDGPPFAREEAWIADYVRRLRGRVFDVGCGEQLYRGEIVPLVRCGAIDYTGLDPDQPSLDDWRAVLPEGRFVRGGIEDFVGTPASYDHVLCLRSLNHVFDLDEAMARMSTLLKPGGELLVVETTPFAMLRSAQQVAAADRAPRAGHQHYRNVTSEDVLPYARRRGLRIAHHHPVGMTTTNEWILLLEA